MNLPYWNHNTAYYGWIREQIAGCEDVLDVGCGDGTLARYLIDGDRQITGIDPDGDCIRRAAADAPARLRFRRADFQTFWPEKRVDAVIFSASLHHMDQTEALKKAKFLLKPGGVLVVVGLAAPSTAGDRLRDVLRVIPSAVISRAKHAKPCEELGIPVSENRPPMAEIRAAAEELLPEAELRYGLHYRYLLVWRKERFISEASLRS